MTTQVYVFIDYLPSDLSPFFNIEYSFTVNRISILKSTAGTHARIEWVMEIV